MTGLLAALRCRFTEHEPDDGKVVFDVPVSSADVDENYLRDGFVCLRMHHCVRCGTVVSGELEPVTDAALEEYAEWCERQHGVRPDF